MRDSPDERFPSISCRARQRIGDGEEELQLGAIDGRDFWRAIRGGANDDFAQFAALRRELDEKLVGMQRAQFVFHVVRDEGLKTFGLLVIEGEAEVRNAAGFHAAAVEAGDARDAQPDGIGRGDRALVALAFAFVFGANLDFDFEVVGLGEIGLAEVSGLLHSPAEEFLQFVERVVFCGAVGGGVHEVADERRGEAARAIAPNQRWITIRCHARASSSGSGSVETISARKSCAERWAASGTARPERESA